MVYVSASGALEMKTLVPDNRYPLPSGSARTARAPASVPAAGSVRAKAAPDPPRRKPQLERPSERRRWLPWPASLDPSRLDRAPVDHDALAVDTSGSL